MTLNQLAEKKSAPRLVLNTHEPSEETGFERSQAMQREVRTFTPAQHGPAERLLGTEDRADMIPMDFPTATPQKLWKEARHAPVSQMAVVLSDDGSRGWIALVAPGQPPLLLYMLPILGRLDLRSGEGWEPREEDGPQAREAVRNSLLANVRQMFGPAPAPLPPIPWQPLPQDPPCPISHGPEDSENSLPGFPETTVPSAGLAEAERWGEAPVFAPGV